MKKINLEIVDITKPYNNPRAKVFSRENVGTDIAGIVLDVAAKNKVNPDKIRMYVWDYETWSARCNEFIRTAF